jgi:GNAT superfamily N-acetyltransferase
MSEVKFVTAWRRDNPQHVADARAYWERVGVIPTPQVLERRVNELCTLVYADGQVVAESTAELVVLPGLRQRFAMCRSSVDPSFRRKGLGAELTGYYRIVLEAWAMENQEEKVMGVAVALTSTELVEKQRDPLWLERGIDMALVGYTPTGEQIRVGWFRYVRL